MDPLFLTLRSTLDDSRMISIFRGCEPWLKNGRQEGRSNIGPFIRTLSLDSRIPLIMGQSSQFSPTKREPVSYQCFQPEVLIQLVIAVVTSMIAVVTSMNIPALIIECFLLLQTLKQNQKWNRIKAPIALQINMWHLWYLLKARFMLPCQIPVMFSTDLFVEFPEFYEHGKDPDLFQGKNRLNVLNFFAG